MGRLLETLGLKRIEADKTADEDDLKDVDLSQLCPATAPLDTTLDREALGRKAKEMMEGAANSFIGGRAPVAEVVAVAEKIQPTTLEAEITRLTTAWGAAWASRDIKGYLAFYAAEYIPEKGLSRDAWARQREQRINRAGDIRIEIQNLMVQSSSPDTAVAVFRQIYKTGSFADTNDKEVEWKKIGGQWLIVREGNRPSAKGE